MKKITLGGKSYWAIEEPPSWERAVSMKVEAPSVIQRTVTGREERRRVGKELRVTEMRWDSVVARADLAEVFNATRTLKDERFVVPVWPFSFMGADYTPGDPAVTGAIYGAWTCDDGGKQIAFSEGYPSGAPEIVCPCLVGRLDIREPTMLSDELARIEYVFREDGPGTWSLFPDAPHGAANGPALNDGTVPKVFPWLANWRKQPEGGAVASTDQTEVRVGQARETVTRFYPQDPVRRTQGGLTLEATELIRFLNWWRFVGGDVKAHYGVGLFSPVRLDAHAVAGATTLILAQEHEGEDATARLGTTGFIALTSPYSSEVARVLSLTPPATVTLVSPLAGDWDCDDTGVVAALFGRHSTDELRLSFQTPEIAELEVGWFELPEEMAIPEGEVRGVTIGELPVEAFLYELKLVGIGGAVAGTWRWTGYEKPITLGADTYESKPVSDNGITENGWLDGTSLTLTGPWEKDGPFRELIPTRRQSRLLLTIRSVNPSDALVGENPEVVWTGEADTAEVEWPMVRARFAGTDAIFGRKVPVELIGATCNAVLFDSRCTLDKADWVYLGTVVSSEGHALELQGVQHSSGTNHPGFGFEGWFGYGEAWFTVGGVERHYTVWQSSQLNPGGNTMILTLANELSTEAGSPNPAPPAGTVVSMVPGCDGAQQTCRAFDGVFNLKGKFDNFQNHRGFPFLPLRATQWKHDADEGQGKK